MDSSLHIKDETTIETIAGGGAPRKAKTVPSVEKMIGILFSGIFIMLFLSTVWKKKKIINEEYAALLDQLNDVIKTERLAKKKCFFMTMHPLTLLQLQNYVNCDIRIHQI